MSTPDHSSTAAQLALASRGDALTPYLDAALRRRFASVGQIDPELTFLQRYTVAALTFRPNRSRWAERFFKSTFAIRLRSSNAVRVIKAMPSTPDLVVQVHALFRQSEIPGVLYIDCTHAQSANQWPGWNPLRGAALRDWYRRESEIYTEAKHLFAFSEPTRLSLISDYGVDPARVTVVGAGVNFLELPTLPASGRVQPEGDPTILMIGNDFVRKGGLVLLEAFRQVVKVIPNAKLRLVGSHPGVPEQHGVEILGRIYDRERVAALYAEAAVFAVPSYFDPFPLVALEAMAFALPVVTTVQMGTPEMIVDGVTGRLVQPGDVDALAEALIDILLDPAAAARMGAAARRDIEQRLTWDAVVARMAPVIENVTAQAKG